MPPLSLWPRCLAFVAGGCMFFALLLRIRAHIGSPADLLRWTHPRHPVFALLVRRLR